jgi:hypothetical protein
LPGKGRLQVLDGCWEESMQDQLLPTDQMELAKATAKVVEAERALQEDHRSGIKWGFLPAGAIAVGVYLVMGDFGASFAARILLAVVSGLGVGAWIEVLFLRKRVLALEALVQLHKVRERNAP